MIGREGEYGSSQRGASGVRCRNEELLAMGLTLPGFVDSQPALAFRQVLVVAFCRALLRQRQDLTEQIPPITPVGFPKRRFAPQSMENGETAQSQNSDIS
jgi:hypothetical protein